MLYSVFGIIALVCFAAASPALKIVLSGSPAITNVDDLAIMTTLINNGSEAIRLLQGPYTVLTESCSDKFRIVSAAGSPEFTGADSQSLYKSILMADQPTITLSPGKSVELVHNLAGLYDFTQSGAGQYNFSVNPTFTYVGASGVLASVTAEVRPHVMNITGNLVSDEACIVESQSHWDHQEMRFSGCSSSRQRQVEEAAKATDKYVSKALQYLANATHSSESFVTWFGDFSPVRLKRVKKVFEKIGNAATRTAYLCNDCSVENEYTLSESSLPGYIFICPKFGSLPRYGKNSQAGWLLYELSRFPENGGAKVLTAARGGAKSLAQSNPDRAVRNAYSYKAFVEMTDEIQPSVKV